MDPAAELRRTLLVTGVVLTLLGVVHLVVGAGSGAEPGTDSDLRFGGGALVGWGLAWIATARSPEPSPGVVRLLAGAWRLAWVAVTGAPSAFVLVQTAVEVVVPVAVLALLRARERRQAVAG